MSIGSHLTSHQKQQLRASDNLKRRVWWSCFSLERLLQLECGRPSVIDLTQDYGSFDGVDGFGLPSDDDGESARDSVDDEDKSSLFTAWISLADIMGQISERFYNHRFGHAVEMLSKTARLARCLTQWELALPEHLKPQSSTFATESGHDHVMAHFLAQQFYHAQIAVLRVAILFPHQGFQKEVNKRGQEQPDIKRLLGASSQCVNAARSLITLTLQLADAGVQSTLIAVPQTFLASVVLALSILRSPRSRLARSDVELLTSATSYLLLKVAMKLGDSQAPT